MSSLSEIAARLPTSKSDDEKTTRNALFKQFDPNGNGYLSLAEVDKGLREVICLIFQPLCSHSSGFSRQHSKLIPSFQFIDLRTRCPVQLQTCYHAGIPSIQGVEEGQGRP
uniref:EF-hand domain-containing protein n=1 Tax=Hanusia phi TaxID=3032 RepID=A0A6T7RTW3_9CRYP|mmetsp:Transcript_3034/g.7350  ORF Transcript_3034/g.7350 Transcript_3034/m.7350 type:complete len:111 (+) Transcript_3034:58-390(+)